ncbi:phosphotransferase [Streptomyces sp. YIM S03343]
MRAGGRAATFWELLPPHGHGTEADLAPLLRQMHQLPKPSFPIGRLQPFVRVAERLAAARSANDDDRTWLLNRLDELKQQWAHLPIGRPQYVIHGDAWGSNCAVTAEGAPHRSCPPGCRNGKGRAAPRSRRWRARARSRVRTGFACGPPCWR